MASLIIIPESDAFFPSASQCCPVYGGFRHSPIRRQNQFQCRPAASRLSRLLDQVEREREFENLWAPTLLLHLKKRRSGKKESNNVTEDTDKQSSDKTEEEKQSHTDAEEKTSNRNFSVSLELGEDFEPSEISVKLVGKCLNIEGKHEEKGDDGHFSCRQFTRSYYLPEDVDIENLTSALSEEGVLTVEAPRLQLKERETVERNIPIQQATSPDAVEEKAERNLLQDDNETSEAEKSEADEGLRDTSNQSLAAERTREDSQ